MWCMQVENIHLLVGDGNHTFLPSMFIARCSERENIRRIMKGVVMAYLLQFIKYCLVKNQLVCLLKDRGLYKNMETGTLSLLEFTSECQVALRLHTGFLILYHIHYWFRILVIKLMCMVLLRHFINPKKVFGPCFLYPEEFITEKISSRPKKKLDLHPPSNSERLLFKGMILKENLKSICIILVSHGFMHTRNYFLGNWVSNKYWWNPRFQL